VRVVLDTNVFIAAVVADGLCRDLVRVRVLPQTLITSEPLLHELRTISRSKFAVDPVELPLLAQLNEEAEIVTPAELRGGVCRDEDDDVVLATALAGKADVIVTGDEDLLVLKKFRGIEILSPRQFLKLLDRTS
jgi:putative PIN family toxin of toxin-antitoxin system